MKVSKLVSLLFVVSLVTLINAPTLKIILISSEVINIIGISLIVVTGSLKLFLNEKIVLNKSIIITLISIWCFWIILLASTYWSPVVLDLKNLFKYLSVFIISFIILLTSEKKDARLFIVFQLIWSLYIAILNLSLGIQVDSSLGQHYLTVGFPIGIGLVISTGLLINYINNKQSKYKIIFMILFFILFLVSLINLSGRSPVFMSIAVILLTWLMYIVLNKKKRLRNLLLLIIVTISGYFLIIKAADTVWINRFQDLLESTEDEPRWLIYKNTLNLIQQNPIKGYGLDSYSSVASGTYPHNIFLEVMFYGGFSALIFLVIIIINFLINMLRVIKNKDFESITISMIALYSLFIWNFSYSLSDTTMVFSSICFLIGISKQNFIK
ncbi:O-antigen ligase family protein [Oceanobacillus kimchii]|uniref:O-antigen polymerase n=1 Tax=Oceanobacillus kimchii TaxID=746691 RepID=A0ABQ5TP72_9BACI|nr:O-antigen ligase family protein [Oceanobacillus kimchii]GLO67574.1 O-antigen polymerase [Oceanobacillus kimchii]